MNLSILTVRNFLSVFFTLNILKEFSGLHYCLFVKVRAKQSFVWMRFRKLAFKKSYSCKGLFCDSSQWAASLRTVLCISLLFAVTCFTRNSFILSCACFIVNSFFCFFTKTFLPTTYAVEFHSIISNISCQLLDIVPKIKHSYNSKGWKWAKKRNLNLSRFFFHKN